MIAISGLSKSYWRGGAELPVIRNVELEIEAGEFVAIMGPSGSGKSTLLNIIGCLDTHDRGSYRLDGEEVSGGDTDALARIRARYLGFVFQSFNLIASRTALENVALPLLYQGVARSQRRERALQALRRVDLDDRADHLPNQLSGGQQQRVAIARALVNSPSLLLADEPTGNLDPETADGVFNYLLGVVRETQTAALIATHNPELARRMDRILRLEDGHVVEQQ